MGNTRARSQPGSMGDCPLCGRRWPTVAELESHADSHFHTEVPTAAAAAAGTATVRCNQCGAAVAAQELPSHQLAHTLEHEELQLATASNDAAARAATGQLDAQTAAELASSEWGGGGDEDAATDAAHQAQLEDLYFQELRAKYGFASQPVRPGCCQLCGCEGHWATDCDRNPDKQAAAARVLSPPLPPRIIATQQRAEGTHMCGGTSLVHLLAACLEQQQVPASMGYQVGLCGEVQHFGASIYSSGWGCGWNNMQMLASHLLAARLDARQVLFGGAGWVPDISALQAWLEAAWQAGFDVQGAAQLDGHVQGTKKWVGTTECAALLRRFGMRAQIVDFGVPSGQAVAGSSSPVAAVAAVSGTALNGGAVHVHPNLACDDCGQCPIVGDRYKPEALPNCDLCAACHACGSAVATGPYRQMMPSAVRLPAQQQQQQQGGRGGMKERLLQWVWHYFMAGDDGVPPSSSSSAACDHRAVGGLQAAAGPRTGAAVPNAKRQCMSPPLPRVRMSGKPPLYFQHEGHSCTIVGIERRLLGRERRAEYTLLILDPGTPGSKLAAALFTRNGWQRLLKRGAHTLRNQQYQLLFVQQGLATGPQLDALKVVAAVERYS